VKRHLWLVQLSRDHHVALRLARRARLAAHSGDAGEIADCARQIVLDFPVWIEPHFRDEENGVLAALTASGERLLVARTLDEHARLRAFEFSLMRPSAPLLADFAGLMDAHVRFEERELLETAQRLLFPDG
jgi:hypothetical protein